MGYGHLRAAQPLADVLSAPLFEVDHPPLGDARDALSWKRARAVHEGVSRVSQWPLVGPPFRALMDAYTHIAPMHPARDLSASTLATRSFARLIDRGLGARLVEHLHAGGRILSTFYAPSLIADRARLPCWCLVTDADCHRIWAPDRPQATTIDYFAPSQRVVERLGAYGVPEARIKLTGFPLPQGLLGGPELPALRRNLAARLRRLDPSGEFHGAHAAELAAQLPEAPSPSGDTCITIVFAVGGAGAQLPLAHSILKSLAPELRAGRLRLALVAGVRKHVADSFSRWAAELGPSPGLEILYQPAWPAYYRRFNELLARADVLWTKPSELTFYAALGLPLVLAPPVGAHERYNAPWAQEHGAALWQLQPERAAGWLGGWAKDGTLAEAAWSGFRRLPSRGTYEIAAAVTNSTD